MEKIVSSFLDTSNANIKQKERKNKTTNIMKYYEITSKYLNFQSLDVIMINGKM